MKGGTFRQDYLLENVKYDIRKSNTRVRNKAFYDLAYRPVPRELREMEELAHIFHVDTATTTTNTTASQSEVKEPISTLLRPSTADPKCVCLKQEPVTLKSVKPNMDGVPMNGLRELILLSHGVILSSADFHSWKRTVFRSMGQKMRRKTYDYCSHVHFITSVMDEDGVKFSIHISGSRK